MSKQYEDYLAAEWERINANWTAYCCECGTRNDEAAEWEVENYLCVACYDIVHCETCKGTTRIGAPWAPDTCPDCLPAATTPTTNYKPF